MSPWRVWRIGYNTASSACANQGQRNVRCTNALAHQWISHPRPPLPRLPYRCQPDQEPRAAHVRVQAHVEGEGAGGHVHDHAVAQSGGLQGSRAEAFRNICM
jgi:hypothetical protein